jgi:hypothetical protein
VSVHLYTNLQRVDFADGHVSVYSTLTGKTWNVTVYKGERPVDRRQRRSKEAAVRTAHELAAFWEGEPS